MEYKASSTPARRAKLAWIFRLIGALLRLALFLAILAAWAGVFSTGSMMLVYAALGTAILYVLLWGITYLFSRRFRQSFQKEYPVNIVLAGLPLLIAGISLLLGFAYLTNQQTQTYVGILAGLLSLLTLAVYIGESLDKRNPDMTLLEGCAEGCGEGCFETLFSGLLHI